MISVYWSKMHKPFFYFHITILIFFLFLYIRKSFACECKVDLAKVRQHLLDNLDDKPTDETERAPMKKKISFPYCFFILTHRVSPVSGPMHRLAIVQHAFSSTWYMHDAIAADWPA